MNPSIDTPFAMASDPSAPLVLTVPGLWNSGPDHWQTIWDRERRDCARIELGCWDDPIRNVWMSRVDQVIHDARRDIVWSRTAWAVTRSRGGPSCSARANSPASRVR